VKNQKRIKNRSFFFLISFLFLTSLLSIKTLKKVNIQDIRISGSELFSQNDVIKNSSLNFPIRLIFVETNLLEKELKQNLSLKNVSVNRELFPFGLKVNINTRIPIAYGERIIKDEKIAKLKYFKKFLLILLLKFYLIHRFCSLPEVYHYHQCNDHL